MPKRRLSVIECLVAPIAMRVWPIESMQWLCRRHGDVVELRAVGHQFFILNHPRFVKLILVDSATSTQKPPMLKRAAKVLMGQGLITSEGEVHERQQRLVRPAFKKDLLNAYAPVIVEITDAVADQWLKLERLDLTKAMKRLSLVIAARVFLGIDLLTENVFNLAELERHATIAVRSLRPFARGDVKTRRFREAKAYLDWIVNSVIRGSGWQREGMSWTPLVEVLKDAAYDDASGQHMTLDMLHDEVMTMLLAAHETVAQAMSWTWYCVTAKPDIESRLQAEALARRGSDRMTRPGEGDLRLTRAAIAEAMRLYPPIWVMGRTLEDDLVVDDWVLPRGSAVALSQYLLHRDARFWTEPNKFDPDRWLANTPATADRYAYFPFGLGPRHCLGEAFAWMEAMLVTATLRQRLRIAVDKRYRPKLDPAFTLGARPAMMASISLPR